MAEAFEKTIIVTRKTRLEELIARFNTKGQAQFYIEQNALQQSIKGGNGPKKLPAKLSSNTRATPDPIAQDNPSTSTSTTQPTHTAEVADFADYEREHSRYRTALSMIQKAASSLGKVQTVDRAFLPNFLFSDRDVIVTLGQDGLVANTAKYVGSQPIVAFNPDRSRFDGILMPFTEGDAAEALEKVFSHRYRARAVTLAEVELSDGQRLRAFNDLFVGARSHVSARYRISVGRGTENHISSGVIISTGAGSTGWLSSIFNMVAGVSAFAGAPITPRLSLPWEDRRLIYVVREPFRSRVSQVSLIAGMLEPGQTLTLESLMASDGAIFSDGIESDFLAFNSGTTATIRASDQQARLVVK